MYIFKLFCHSLAYFDSVSLIVVAFELVILAIPVCDNGINKQTEKTEKVKIRHLLVNRNDMA